MRNKIKPAPVILFFELFLSIPYPAITFYTAAEVFLKYLRLLFVLLELVYFFLSARRSRFGAFRTNREAIQPYLAGIGIVVYALVFFLISLMKGQSIVWMVNNLTPFLLVVLAMQRSARLSLCDTLEAAAFFFWITICLNFLTIIIFGENGMYIDTTDVNVHNCYLLGVDNQFGKYFFPGITLIWFYEEYTKQKKQVLTYTALGVVFLSCLITLTGTACVVSVLYIGLFVMYKTKIMDRFLNLPLFAGIILLLLLGIFFQAGIMYGNSKLGEMITTYTGKSMTFSGRTNIWAEAVKKFWDSPLFGYGKQIDNYMVTWKSGSFSCHNVFLQTLLEVGFVGVVFFIVPFLIAAKHSFQVVGKYRRCRSLRILYIGFFCTSVYFMMEVGTLIPLFMIAMVMSICSISFRKKGIL